MLRNCRPICRCLPVAALLLAVSYSWAEEKNLAEQPGVLVREFVYETAPFPQCHASTVAQANEGTLVSAWFGGTREKHPDVGIWVSRRVEGKWTTPVEVANGVQDGGKRFPCWNPVLFQPSSGPLLLFYKVGPSPRDWWGLSISSTDGGKTWSTPQRLPEGILGPIKNKPVELSAGEILSPSSTEHDGWRVHFERTMNGGKNWTKAGPVDEKGKFGVIQPAILRHGKDELQAMCRSQQGKIVQTWSKDRGVTWSELTALELPNPNSGIDAVTLADGRHLLIYNHTGKGRSPLNLAASGDGKTWQAALVLETEPGEYSYPAIVQTPDGLVHLTYTWKRQRVRHVVIDPTKLSLREMTKNEWPTPAIEQK